MPGRGFGQVLAYRGFGKRSSSIQHDVDRTGLVIIFVIQARLPATPTQKRRNGH
jgi:hypothetical protein